MPAGIPRVRVDFTVDTDGPTGGSDRGAHWSTTSVEVTPSYGLTDDEIEQMLEDAIDHAEDDIDTRFLIECRVEGEQILHHIQKAMAQDAALMQGDEESQFLAAVSELQEALKGTDRRKIQACGAKVDEISAPFAQRRIERDLDWPWVVRLPNVAERLALIEVYRAVSAKSASSFPPIPGPPVGEAGVCCWANHCLATTGSGN